MVNRRGTLIGLGGLVAGGGALIGTGAFTTVTAERTVNVQTAGDANAFLALGPADRDGNGNNAYVADRGDGTVEIALDGSNTGASGLNQNARTTFRNLITVTNNGTQAVESLTLTMSVSTGNGNGNGNAGVDANDTFEFTVSPAGGNSSEGPVANGNDILTGNNSIPDTLNSGSSINFGLVVDLLAGGNNGGNLPGGLSYTLTIEAQTANSN